MGATLSWHIHPSRCQNVLSLLHKGVKINYVRLIISSLRNPSYWREHRANTVVVGPNLYHPVVVSVFYG